MARLGTFSKDLIQNGAFDETIQPDGLYDYTFENLVIVGFPIIPVIHKISVFLQTEYEVIAFNEVVVSNVSIVPQVTIASVTNLGEGY